MKKIYVSILAAAFVAMPALAQENLQKEITLPKDFVPVVKKPVKKSALPRVLKPVKSDEGKVIGFTDWAEPTAVSVEIPTMLPLKWMPGRSTIAPGTERTLRLCRSLKSNNSATMPLAWT